MHVSSVCILSVYFPRQYQVIEDCTLVWFCITHYLESKRYESLSSHLIYPLTERVVGAPQMILLPVSSIFSSSPLPSGTCRTPGPPISWCCLPASFSVLSSSPFYCALQDGFGQTWWTGDMTTPLQFGLFTMVRRSSCGPIACWISAPTSSLVTRSLCEMCSS